MGDTKTELLEATAAVLAGEGFHGLTTAKVAEEADASQSLVHYHFETKADLVVAFVEFYRERFEERLAGLPEAPGERLPALLAYIAEGGQRSDVRDLGLAVYELQAYAGREEAYRDALADYDAMLHGTVVDCLAAGVEDGTFRPHDPETTARLLLAALDGALLTQYTVAGVDPVDQVALDGLGEYVLADLYVGEPPDLADYAASVEVDGASVVADADRGDPEADG